LQAAVCLLPLFAGVLFLGTVIESWHGRPAAVQLVYRTWWFATLLALLGVNVFFAAAKKWPWRRHQTGFLITHAGLLTLVAGGLLDSLAGTGGTLTLVDSDDLAAARHGPHTSGRLLDRGEQRLTVQRPRRGEVFEAAFDPGPLPWSTTEVLPRRVDGLTAFLAALARPLPPGWARHLGEDARLEVLAYYPHVRVEPFRAVDREPAFPAVAVQLVSAVTGLLPPQWVAYHSGQRSLRLGPGLVEMLAHGCRPEQVAEFLRPPGPEQLGGKGQLVLGLGGKVYRFDVDRLGAAPEPLGASGWLVRLLGYLPDFQHSGKPTPSNPAVKFALEAPQGGKAGFATAARQAGELAPLDSSAPLPPGLGELWAWYHPPDYRHGDAALHAVLQFAAGADGRLHYRSFASAGTIAFAFEKSGAVEKGDGWHEVWRGMDWRFRIVNHLPRAVPGPHFVPVERGLSAEDAETTSALHCRLRRGSAAEEFWVGKTLEGATPVTVGGERFLVGYHPVLRDLDFELTLLRAEQTTDKGSSNPAGQASYVVVRGTDESGPGRSHRITLNEPLGYRGYKIYQADLRPLGRDENGKPYHQVTFAVNRDPGLYLKYVGSSLLALGIACMYYMKAYLFKPRGRRAADTVPEA
jgi:hypothetical protein